MSREVRKVPPDWQHPKWTSGRYIGLFPDDTLAADGPRYKAIGNGMATKPVRWIFRRIHAAFNATGGREARTCKESMQ